MGVAPMKSLQCRPWNYHEMWSGWPMKLPMVRVPWVNFHGIFHWSDVAFHGNIIDVSWHTSLLVYAVRMLNMCSHSIGIFLGIVYGCMHSMQNVTTRTCCLFVFMLVANAFISITWQSHRGIFPFVPWWFVWLALFVHFKIVDWIPKASIQYQ